MVKLTREQFIGILESGKYHKIQGKLWDGTTDSKTGAKNVCAIGAILTDTGNVNSKAAPGFTYLPKQLVDDLQITPEIEQKIYGTNDKTKSDNWAAVVKMLRKEWNISEFQSVNLYDAEQVLEGYFTEYYSDPTPIEDYGYNM